MNGRILAYDPAAGTGVISGEDGKRYGFSRAEWKGSSNPRPDAVVDFEARASEATAIYGLEPAAAWPGNKAGALRASDAVGRAGALLREGPEARLALAVLFACLLTFLSVTPSVMGMTAGEGASRAYSLFGSGGDLLATIDGFLAPIARSSESDLGMAGILLAPRWLAPVTALILLYACWRGKRLRSLAMFAGVGAVIAFLNAAIFAFAIEGMANRSGGVTSVAIDLGAGAWLLLLCGIGLVLAAKRRIANPLATNSIDGA